MTDDARDARTRELDERLAPIGEAVGFSDFARASRLAAEALTEGFEQPALYSLRALGLEQEGRLEAALVDLDRAVELAPEDFTAHNAMGLCLMRLSRLPDALEAFRRAIQAGPAFAPAYYNLGRAHEQLGRLLEAAGAYETAIRHNRGYVEPMASLSDLALRRGVVDQARAWAERAAGVDADNPRTRLALANLALSEKNFTEAARQLEPLIRNGHAEPLDHALAQGLLGDALDGLDMTVEAFAAYTLCNQEIRALYADRFEGRSVAQALTWMTAFFDKAPVTAWSTARQAQAPDEVETHAFLVGFPHSGAARIAQALAGHPDVSVVEERDLLVEATADFLTDVQDLHELQALPEDRLEAYRRAYWRRAKGYGFTPGRKVFVDSQPLNTLKLPLIAKLFPRAKILFAMRDPRDVALACFRQRLQVNATTFEMLCLERAARFYASTMALREIYRAKLRQEETIVGFEAMARNFEAEARAVCGFLGIEFDERMAAGGPDQADVGGWRRYARELSPAVEILKTWVERFGYPLD
jgi:tetratricopeptide (TPR) repeat protein